MPGLLQPDPGYDWRCQRCGHQWRSRDPHAPEPKQCAHCRSAYWTRPKTGVKKSNKNPTIKTMFVLPQTPDLAGHPLLAPPPHMRNQTYYPPEPEPTPENTITRDPAGDGTLDPAIPPEVDSDEET